MPVKSAFRVAGWMHKTGTFGRPRCGRRRKRWVSTPLIIDPLEVKSAFEVPLPFLLDEGNEQLAEREFEGVTVPIAEFRFGQYRIWGATASMLIQLRKFLIDNQ